MSELPNKAIYAPLDPRSKDIRLMILHPDVETQPIKCDLTMARLSDEPPPKYAALSYEWGDPESPLHEIVLSGHPFLIRENLWLFLNSIRSKVDTLVLWVDALCINQTDNRERNHQVGVMDDIYRKADVVRAWLGPEEEIASSANSGLQLTAFVILEDIYKSCSMFQWTIRQYFLRAEEESKVFPQIQNCLSRLCNNLYWSRIWIVQEFVLAGKVLLHYGRTSIDSRFLEVAVVLASNDLDAPYERDEVDKLLFHLSKDGSQAGRLIGHRVGLEENSLGRLIYRYYAWKATDPRDMIYGIIRLAEDVTEDEIVIDYAKSVLEVKFDAALFFCRKFDGGLLMQQALLNLDRLLPQAGDHNLSPYKAFFLHVLNESKSSSTLKAMTFQQMLDRDWTKSRFEDFRHTWKILPSHEAHD